MRSLFEGGDLGSSFFDLLALRHPDLLPHFPVQSLPPSSPKDPREMSHGTTILALRFRGGVVIAGDRQATEGYQVASRRIEKVFTADAHSAIAIAGVAGPCTELAKLFQTELAHYEKLEGISLSTEGKANKLAQMVKSNLPMAMQGLVVVPIFVGYDLARGEGKIYKYDITGGRYEETEYYSTGSGGVQARGTLKKVYRKDLDRSEAIRVALEALFDAADEDVGTAGPDFVRRIFPTVKIVTREGIQDVEDSLIQREYEAMLPARREGGS